MAKGVPNFGGRGQTDCNSIICNNYTATITATPDLCDGRGPADVANGQFGDAIRISALTLVSTAPARPRPDKKKPVELMLVRL